MTTVEPLDCDGYRTLLDAVVNDEGPDGKRRDHDYRGKLAWVVDRAQHYAEKTGLTAESILDAWEKRRSYWYMNFYQEANQPKITTDAVRVFDTVEDLLKSVGNTGFRCPHCNGVSSNPYECNSGLQVELINLDGKKGACNWKVYGLLGHLGKGVSVFVKDQLTIEKLFKPVAWEVSP